MRRVPRPALLLALSAAVLLAIPGCSLNPATGKRQLVLFGESQEIEMGRAADKDVVASMGSYPDAELQAFVNDLGTRLAQLSERPDLPWTFRVVDDPLVNAFALPGGYIYVTRGILAHFGSEAELAAVLGHEIGHVTARHSVNQMSKAQLATIGLGVGSLIEPELERFGNLAGAGMGLLFLKYGRDDERQADDLGLRYLRKGGYAPTSMVEVFELLDNVGRAHGGASGPNWLATHPSPGNRKERIETTLASAGRDPNEGLVRAGSYLKRLDGLVFGEDPRHGFFRESTFLHPDLRFRFDFPPGWKKRNSRQSVVGMSDAGDAAISITLARDATPAAAADRFFSQDGVGRGPSWLREVHGLPAASNSFTALSGDTTLRGLVLFVAHAGNVFQILGYTPDSRASSYSQAIETSLSSFARLTEPDVLNTQPMRLEVRTLTQPLSLQRFQDRYPSAISLEQLALINHTSPAKILPAGSQVKRVVGGR